MKDQASKYDVAIIGSGIGGSTLATVLARQGLQVTVELVRKAVSEQTRYSLFALNRQRRTQTRQAMQTGRPARNSKCAPNHSTHTSEPASGIFADLALRQ